MQAVPIIAIVGRPNVGKSTLFNRLIGKRYAVVSEVAGTTRDRIYQEYECFGYKSLLVDTGGLQYGKKVDIEADIEAQAKVAITEANIILFTVDLSHELTVDDFAAADILRKSEKPVILVANKSDNKKLEENIYNLYELGFGDPVQVSAIHKIGIEILENKIQQTMKKLKIKKQTARKVTRSANPNVAVLGKPNAGKSSLLNGLLGSNKVIVSDIPGTTRDTIDTEIKYQDKKYNFIDTAGLKRPGRIDKGIDKFSSLRTMQAVERADVVLLMVDASQRISQQDCHIAQLILEEKKGLVLVVNKVDLLEEKGINREQIAMHLKRKFAFIPWAPVVFISAKNKKNIFEIFRIVDEILAERKKRIPTSELNNFFQKIIHKHLPASVKIKKPKFLYITQAEIEPPTFTLFFNHAANLHFTYPRYLENEIRKEYGFNGTAIELKIKGKSNKI